MGIFMQIIVSLSERQKIKKFKIKLNDYSIYECKISYFIIYFDNKILYLYLLIMVHNN